MGVAPRYKLLTLFTLLTLFDTVFTALVYTVQTAFTLLKQ